MMDCLPGKHMQRWDLIERKKENKDEKQNETKPRQLYCVVWSGVLSDLTVEE